MFAIYQLDKVRQVLLFPVELFSSRSFCSESIQKTKSSFTPKRVTSGGSIVAAYRLMSNVAPKKHRCVEQLAALSAI